jgi:hypothetical protein
VYQDEITECLASVFLDHDPETALARLEGASVIVKADPFCREYATEFVTAVKEIVAEFYCKVYGRASIAKIAGLVGLKADEIKGFHTREGAHSEVKLIISETGKEVGSF